MHQLGYDPTSLLQKAGEIRRVWDFADLPPLDQADGLPRIGTLMAAPAATMTDDPVYDGLETCLPTPDPLDTQRREVARRRMGMLTTRRLDHGSSATMQGGLLAFAGVIFLVLLWAILLMCRSFWRHRRAQTASTKMPPANLVRELPPIIV
ncbi:hypothetical protein SPRG_11577 [Saprolegnia parasitica CBS 223.65]|uniref:Uncharacterized protein n=1 Tax=Saprolegnia parasitica (strain CBS 223.65) TaxID=695850 RepID=A0A067BX29_SAPPC|nr:hypothetical protein SPRG_11577 [Saprolegnia parasitica CBS 223.65]KDO22818.1 hypothetical protein SPRG_11577 [Saprolegnia parasitica CBS 223.65]|eukprot:XP_012206489.1 hypothetical protein SPRG_11577 [Saprolegnia parasitica CBS 223.65]